MAVWGKESAKALREARWYVQRAAEEASKLEQNEIVREEL